MRRIKEYKWLEDDQLQNKDKAPVINHPRHISFQSRPWKDLRIQELGPQMGKVNVAFKEPIHRIVDRIKNEPFFRWSNKMGEDPSGETKTCIVLTIEIEGIPLSSVGC